MILVKSVAEAVDLVQGWKESGLIDGVVTKTN